MKTSTKIRDSWAVQKIEYDYGNHVLTITMQNAPPKSHGEVLRYGSVPRNVYDGLVNAPSKGYYFNTVIRPGYNLI